MKISMTKQQLEQKIQQFQDGLESKVFNEHSGDNGHAKVYQCNQCSGAFRNDCHLWNHTTERHKWTSVETIPTFLCDQCPERFIYKFDLIIHLDLDHREIKYPHKPQNPNDKKELYTKHYISASDFYAKNPGACDRCCKFDGTPDELLEHKNHEHPGWEIPHEDPLFERKEYIYKCIQCSGAFRLQEDLIEHQEAWHQVYEKIRRHFAVTVPPSCGYCNKHIETREQKLEHSLIEHLDIYGKFEWLDLNHQGFEDLNEEEIEETIEQLQKRLTDGIYTDEFDFDKTPYETDGFEDVTGLRYKCDYCSGAFENELRMMNHVQLSHPGEIVGGTRPNYFCDRCPQRFVTESELDAHFTHDILADKLRFSTVIEENEYRVMRSMTKSDFYSKYPGACNECFENFETAELMLEHKNDKHPGWENEEEPKVYVDDEYTFKCNERKCTGAFRLEQDFEHHQQKVHPKVSEIEERIFCDKCNFHFFPEMSEFSAHNQQAHNGTATGVPTKVMLFPGGRRALMEEEERYSKTEENEKTTNIDFSIELE